MSAEHSSEITEIIEWVRQGRQKLRRWYHQSVHRLDGTLSSPPVPQPPGFEEVARFVLEVWALETEVNCRRAGWYDDARTFGDEMALLHSEVSEALDAYRKRGFDVWQRDDGKPEGVPFEFADIFIRLLDDCVRQGVDLVDVYRLKQDFNWTRPYRHGDQNL